MAVHTDDCRLLDRAIELAQGAVGLSDPNPRVGCVIHDAAGGLAGEGFTQQAGGPHAEVMALRAAAARDLRGGTAWVSLEPCAHHGRTPPCCDALIAAGLARVVVATIDPHDQVAGQGVARLRAAGITVDLAQGLPQERLARELNIGFFSRMLRRRPWVRMKAAASLDGRTALPNGQSQWITGETARLDGHRWRKRAGAILSGIGTVRADDARLDVRLVETQRQPLRVIVDSQLSIALDARVLDAPGSVLLAAAGDGSPERADALRARGVEVVALPAPDGHRVHLSALLALLTDRGINELHVEAGATLNAALLAADLVDELLVYLAPCLLGPGRDIAALPALTQLADASRWRFHDVEQVGEDLRLRLRPPGRDAFFG